MEWLEWYGENQMFYSVVYWIIHNTNTDCYNKILISFSDDDHSYLFYYCIKSVSATYADDQNVTNPISLKTICVPRYYTVWNKQNISTLAGSGSLKKATVIHTKRNACLSLEEMKRGQMLCMCLLLYPTWYNPLFTTCALGKHSFMMKAERCKMSVYRI